MFSVRHARTGKRIATLGIASSRGGWEAYGVKLSANRSASRELERLMTEIARLYTERCAAFPVPARRALNSEGWISDALQKPEKQIYGAWIPALRWDDDMTHVGWDTFLQRNFARRLPHTRYPLELQASVVQPSPALLTPHHALNPFFWIPDHVRNDDSFVRRVFGTAPKGLPMPQTVSSHKPADILFPGKGRDREALYDRAGLR